MAAYLDKEKLNTAITDSTKFDLSHVHITTGNFMQLQPIYNKEMVPGEKIDVKLETLARMNPLQVPTYGRCNIKNRAYFVPMRTIFRGWNDFITDAPHTDSANAKSPSVTIPTRVPIVRNNTIMTAFMTSVWSMWGADERGVTTTGADASTYDIVAQSEVYYRFTAPGRIANKLLESLGYKVNWNIYDETPFSALPLLALAKVYVDWYFPNVYTNDVNYNKILALLNYDNNAAELELTSDQVALILQQCIFVCYDSDYFTSAWDNPTMPGAGKVSNYDLPNLDYMANIRMNNTYYNYNGNVGHVSNNQEAFPGYSDSTPGTIYGASAPFIAPYVPMISTNSSGTASNSAGAAPISQYLLHSLHALTDYLHRHQLVGSKAMDRYLARYGKALPAEKLNRSVYLGSQMVPVQVGDVMSNSDTDGAGLGQYAGKGMAYNGNGDFSYSTDEFGIFIVLSSIVPAAGYFQGRNRLNTMHIRRLQFWTPEFESIGTQPISADELYVSQDGTLSISEQNETSDSSYGVGLATEKVFGYTPRYAEYKMGYDQVTGNFRVRTLNGDINTNNGSGAWHLMRQFDDSDFPGLTSMVHSLNFVYSKGDLGRYNRIFAYTDPEAPDQFTLIHQFNIGDYAPMKPLYDSYDWLDKGRKVTLDVNGVKHN